MGKVIIKVSQDGSRFFTDENFTLYYFPPQRLDPKHEGPSPKNPNGIPFMDNMPDYLKFWMQDWSPLTGDPEFDPEAIKRFKLDPAELSHSMRDAGPKVKEYQIMFRGWFLYYYKGDNNPNLINGEVSGLWHRAGPDLVPITAYGGHEKPFDQAIHGGP